jgi:ABC-type sulfate transport system permease component
MTISQRAVVRRQSAFSEIREAARDEGLRTAASMTGLFAFATVLITAVLGSGWN